MSRVIHSDSNTWLVAREGLDTQAFGPDSEVGAKAPVIVDHKQNVRRSRYHWNNHKNDKRMVFIEPIF